MSFYDDLREILQPEQNLTPQRVCELIAERWGGDQPYIPRKCNKPIAQPTDTPRTLIDRGVPRATAYRLARKNWISGWK